VLLSWPNDRRARQRAGCASSPRQIASSVAQPRRKRSSAGAIADACVWAIASARRDREIVSSALLILVISKRVTDLSADPPDACSRAAGQLTRRDARLLQSPRNGTLTGGHALAAGIAQMQQFARDCRNPIEAEGFESALHRSTITPVPVMRSRTVRPPRDPRARTNCETTGPASCHPHPANGVTSVAL
jgi:hypothetical protein